MGFWSPKLESDIGFIHYTLAKLTIHGKQDSKKGNSITISKTDPSMVGPHLLTSRRGRLSHFLLPNDDHTLLCLWQRDKSFTAVFTNHSIG